MKSLESEESLETVENMTTDNQATDLKSAMKSAMKSEIKSAFTLDVREDFVYILPMAVPGEIMYTL